MLKEYNSLLRTVLVLYRLSHLNVESFLVLYSLKDMFQKHEWIPNHFDSRDFEHVSSLTESITSTK